MQLQVGQCWTFRAPLGFEHARLVIGAIARFPGGHCLVVCGVTRALRRHADGRLETVQVPFLPLTEAAFWASAVEFIGMGELPDVEGFSDRLADWSSDPAGYAAYTVPFEGQLDRMLGLQMASIAGVAAGGAA